MPPGPTYNFLCALSAAANIVSHAAQYRAAQVAAQASAASLVKKTRNRPPPARTQDANIENAGEVEIITPDIVKEPTAERQRYVHDIPEQRGPEPSFNARPVQAPEISSNSADAAVSNDALPPLELAEPASKHEVEAPVAAVEPEPEPVVITPEDSLAPVLTPHIRNLQSSKVPSSRIGRLVHYGGLAASLGYGAASELLRRTGSSEPAQSSSLMLSEANIKRLVSKLSQMRGAALKLGQFLSIQDTHSLPPEIEKIFRRVQDSAHYMPDWQLEQVLQTSLGPDYASFSSFARIPFAAASIGQVHSAVLKAEASPTGKEADVAIKVQFPNIVNSIDSDIGYVKMILTAGRLLPKGLFLDKTISVMKEELKDECDYSREASFIRRFGSPEYLGNDPKFKVPWVWDGSTKECLVMEKVDGVSVGEEDVSKLSQRDRNDIAARIIELCLRELFQFRVMQTDPNWTNFLWNGKTRQVELVDFGATREYSKEFIDNWLHLLSAAAADDKASCIDWSLKVGYLTGEENELMLDAHVQSMTLLATPFKASTPQPFSFSKGSQWTDITQKIRDQIPVMLNHRLTPPPRETYSLNRKLSGAFLLASRLGAQVDTKSLWDGVVSNYRFD